MSGQTRKCHPYLDRTGLVRACLPTAVLAPLQSSELWTHLQSAMTVPDGLSCTKEATFLLDDKYLPNFSSRVVQRPYAADTLPAWARQAILAASSAILSHLPAKFACILEPSSVQFNITAAGGKRGASGWQHMRTAGQR